MDDVRWELAGRSCDDDRDVRLKRSSPVDEPGQLEVWERIRDNDDAYGLVVVAFLRFDATFSTDGADSLVFERPQH